MNRQQIEREFPVKRHTAYLNNASYTVMVDSAIAEVSRRLKEFSEHGPDDAFYLGYRSGSYVA